MALHQTPLSLYQSQVRRFQGASWDMRRGHEDIADGGLDDWKKLTAGGVGPNGPARVKWLRQLGHPFARGAAPGAGGLKRGVSRSRRKKYGVKSVPNLPIGRISGRLHRSIKKRPGVGGVQRFDVGTTSSAGASANVIKPGGTEKMVFRGFYDPVNKRWRARNKAFQDHFVRKQRKP